MVHVSSAVKDRRTQAATLYANLRHTTQAIIQHSVEVDKVKKWLKLIAWDLIFTEIKQNIPLRAINQQLTNAEKHGLRTTSSSTFGNAWNVTAVSGVTDHRKSLGLTCKWGNLETVVIVWFMCAGVTVTIRLLLCLWKPMRLVRR